MTALRPPLVPAPTAPGVVAGTEQALPLIEALLDAGHLVPTGVLGLYARGAAYDDAAQGVSRLVRRWAASLGAVRLHAPPLVSRATFAETNYLESFPDLMGSVHVFGGGDAEHKELLRRVEGAGDWQALLHPADAVLASAACHVVYPLCRGRLPASGRYYEVSGYCFRHEPSTQAARLQSFVMHEVVYVGSAEAARRHRDVGLTYGLELLGRLGLEMEAVPASDPFFGRVGSVLAAGQLEEELKLEGVTRIDGGDGADGPTAVMSANCHRDHFGRPFAIETADGATAHSSCVAFGIDRVVVALMARYGVEVPAWPVAVRAQLGL